MGWSFFVKFFQTTFLLWKFVVDLSDIDRFDCWVFKGPLRAKVNEEMFLICVRLIKSLLFDVCREVD